MNVVELWNFLDSETIEKLTFLGVFGLTVLQIIFWFAKRDKENLTLKLADIDKQLKKANADLDVMKKYELSIIQYLYHNDCELIVDVHKPSSIKTRLHRIVKEYYPEVDHRNMPSNPATGIPPKPRSQS